MFAEKFSSATTTTTTTTTKTKVESSLVMESVNSMRCFEPARSLFQGNSKDFKCWKRSRTSVDLLPAEGGTSFCYSRKRRSLAWPVGAAQSARLHCKDTDVRKEHKMSCLCEGVNLIYDCVCDINANLHWKASFHTWAEICLKTQNLC